jgi:signal transduction histidine kinase
MAVRDSSRRRLASSTASWRFDVALAVLVTSFIVLATAHIRPSADDRALDALGYASIIVAGGSLVLCRRRPWIVVVVVAAALSVYLARHYAGGPIFTTGWIALFWLGWSARRRDAFLAAAGLCVVLIVVGTWAGSGALLVHLLFVGWSAAAVFLGDALRSRREHLADVAERARYLERTREEETLRRVAEDRLRIAQDLHDSVAHSMATINVQAGAAAHVVERRPEAAKEALSAIQRASGDVLDELAALLGLLRSPDDASDRSPTPGLEQIAQLVASTRHARLPVTLTVDGPVDAVAKPVATAAYRIVQESLTNVLRHAGTATAIVAIVATADGALAVSVTDDGSGPGFGAPTVGSGVGIRGMRERAEGTGGRLDAGRSHEGGFAVRASWPGRT